MTTDWRIAAAMEISTTCIRHRNYARVVDDVFTALTVALPGEVVVLVGPSRVGKTRALAEALRQLVEPGQREEPSHYVLLDAENASKDGAFSTKDFMVRACEAICHPIYGVAGEEDPLAMKLATRIERTSQGMLRGAFCRFVKLKQVKYICCDEAHHVQYINGGAKNAAKVLDSWKCLAHHTQSVLVLVGSYQLLRLLLLAPHLLGRQRPIEFPRYRTSLEDLESFESVLVTLSQYLKFEAGSKGLRQWNELLFQHSLGCVGHLCKWLRTALSRMSSRSINFVTEDVLLHTRMPARQEAEIAAEIFEGEAEMALDGDEQRSEPRTPQPTPAARGSNRSPGPKRRPFQPKPMRHKVGGRA